VRSVVDMLVVVDFMGAGLWRVAVVRRLVGSLGR